MADVKLNPILEQLSGKIGDLVFRRYGARTILARNADQSGIEPTEAQRAHRERFRQAIVYGKMVSADPEDRAPYEDLAQKKGHPIFSLFVADFFNAPSVDDIDLSGYGGAVGDPIIIRASDDFEVAGVDVTLTDDSGNEIESGAAVRGVDDRWTYSATVAVAPESTVRIVVTAADRPGGTAQHGVELTV